MILIILITVSVIALITLPFILKHHTIQKLSTQPFPDEWKHILESSLPIHRNIPDTLKEKLHREINIFLGTKTFVSCQGIAVTDAMRLSIAAQACLLIANRTTRHYPKLRTILIYPSTFVAKVTTYENGLPIIRNEHRAGESWNCGMIVLAWDAVEHGHTPNDGHNVVFHEFAHRLDQEDGNAEGYPILTSKDSYVEWEEIFGPAFSALCDRVENGKDGVLRAYGATNPAEFFAVATEAFLERPRILKVKYPRMYDVLGKYYNLDPVGWGKQE